MKEQLQTLAAEWRKEAKSYASSAVASGKVDGQHPVECTAYQQTCAQHSGVYNTCAHQLELIIEKLP